jgi:hypothetical protein
MSVTTARISTDPNHPDSLSSGAAKINSSFDAIDSAIANINTGLNKHRFADTLDHPDGSVTKEKLSPEVIGLIEGSADIVKIADVQMSGQTTIANIPQTYRHLKAYFVSRSVANEVDSYFLIQFNGVTSRDYWAYNTTNAQNSFAIARIPAVNADAGFYSTGELLVFDYANTNIAKSVQVSQISKRQKAVAGVSFFYGGTLDKTDAVTSITFSTSGGFTADSRVVLYGIK